jgi:glycerol-3-phosphate cytidylyltransferase-like family protein
MKLLRRAEFLGTSLFICSYFRYLGSALLLLACPLAYESFRRESIPRVIYVVNCMPHIFDHKVIEFWNQAKSLGSKLLVGVIGENQTNMVQNACSITSVDEVIAEAPARADLIFLERQGIDFVVLSCGQSSLVTDEVKAAGVCIFLDDDQIVQRH